MTHFGYIAAGYGLTAVLIGAYAYWIGARARALLSADQATPSVSTSSGPDEGPESS